MKVLVVGGGGREHAMAWRISRSGRSPEVFIAPGNPGTEEVGQNVHISSDDLSGLADFAEKEGIDLTVVGPEAPLVAGIVDLFNERGLPIFGPTSAAAKLEGSKDYAKKFMAEFDIPTAASQTFTDLEGALAHAREHGAPIVVKADGLAAGKGVTVARDLETAEKAITACLEENVFGEAGRRVVLEDYMTGEEASVLAICDGNDFVCLPSSQDHKPIWDDDKGPNTGGMGAYSPAPVVTEEIANRIEQEILRPAIDGMKKRGTPYVGVLYAGLMITDDGPKVVEFNCRMGDPETQPVLTVLESDLLELFLAATRGELASFGEIQASPKPAVCVILASEGYPGSYPKGRVIEGLDALASDPDVVVFHAGTKRNENGEIITSGGRVLGVTGRGDTIAEAIENTYRAVERIRFEGMYFRKDIGRKALSRTSA